MYNVLYANLIIINLKFKKRKEKRVVIISTLPISYRENRSLKIFFTPFVAKCIANLCHAKALFPIDLMGLRDKISPGDYNQITESYVNSLNRLGLCDNSDFVLSDTDPAFLEYVSETIAYSVSAKICGYYYKPISFCDCGRVELPSDIFETLIAQERMKLIRTAEDGFVCKGCGSPIHKEEKNVLMYEYIGEKPEYNIAPSFYSLQAMSVIQEIVSHPIIVSRSHRQTNGFLINNGEIIDPDYCWSHYLLFLKKKFKQNQFVLVIGEKYIYHAFRVMALTHSLDPIIEVSLIVHPLIDISGIDKQITQKTTIENLINLCGSKEAAQVFLSLFIQWNRPVSAINHGDRHLVKISLEQGLGLSKTEIDTPPSLPLKDALWILKKDTVLKILKKIRKHDNLSSQDQMVLQSIINTAKI